MLIGVGIAIERYFVPEGEGRVLERARGGGLDVVVAIDDRGNAAIKNLLLKGASVTLA